MTMVTNQNEEIEKGSYLFPLLTESQQAAYSGWFDVMVNGRFKMSVADAHRESALLIAKTSKAMHKKEYNQRFWEEGYLKIFSIKLNKKIGVARSESVKRTLNAPPGYIFTVEEVKELIGLDEKELMFLLKARTIFDGVLVYPPPIKLKPKLLAGSKILPLKTIRK